VHARTDLEPERLYGLRDRLRASDRPSGPVERREEAIPGRVDLLPAVSREHPADDRVMSLQELAPSPVAELGRLCGRTDDVREHHGSEYAIEPCLLLHQIANEASDLPEDPVGPAVPVEPVEAPRVLDLHDLGPRDM
jgi:hypothetical protein